MAALGYRRKQAFSARTYGGTQVYDQNFSAIGADRRSETLTRVQRVPAQVVAFSGQWSSPQWHGQTLVAGLSPTPFAEQAMRSYL